jgi:hypothetical protein
MAITVHKGAICPRNYNKHNQDKEKNKNYLTTKKINMRNFILLPFLLAIVFNTFSQTHNPKPGVFITEYTKGYYEYLPEKYNLGGYHPLIINIGGTGEEGNGTTNLSKVLNTGLAARLQSGLFPKSFTYNNEQFQFVIITPQMTMDVPNGSYIDKIIDFCVKNYRVDTTRIYLMGLSMGGRHTYHGAVYSAKRIAAIVPMAPFYWLSPIEAGKIVDAKMGVWAFHDIGDPSQVPYVYSSHNYEELNKWVPGGYSFNKLTSPNRGSHDSWTLATDPANKEGGLNIYEWMLSFKKGVTFLPPIPPTPTFVYYSGKITNALLIDSANRIGIGDTIRVIIRQNKP